MEHKVLLIGLGISLLGAVVTAVGDAWLSRSMLIYLDAVEANVSNIVTLLREGGARLEVTGIDLKRDRGQDRARAVKTLGWLILILGLGVQCAAAYLSRPAA